MGGTRESPPSSVRARRGISRRRFLPARRGAKVARIERVSVAAKETAALTVRNVTWPEFRHRFGTCPRHRRYNKKYVSDGEVHANDLNSFVNSGHCSAHICPYRSGAGEGRDSGSQN